MRCRFINRELSWLEFNDGCSRWPASRRSRCSSGRSSARSSRHNLDEFFQVRVAALKDQVAAGIAGPSPDGPHARRSSWPRSAAVVDELVARAGGRRSSTSWCRRSPQRGHRRSSTGTTSTTTTASVPRRRSSSSGSSRCSRRWPSTRPPVPVHLQPVAEPRGDGRRPRHRRAALRPGQGADAAPAVRRAARRRALRAARAGIAAHLDRCSRAWSSRSTRAFRVTRNADLTLEEEEADDLLAAVEMELRRRRFGRAVRLEVADRHERRDARAAACASSSSTPTTCTVHRGPLDLTCLWQLHGLDRPDLKDQPWPPVTAGRIAAAEEADRSIFSVDPRAGAAGAPPVRELRQQHRGVHRSRRPTTRGCVASR